MTTLSRLSKADTVLLIDQTETDYFVDSSQYRTNLADQSNYADESPSPRAAIDPSNGREIAIVWDIQSGESGTLVELGNGSGYSYRIMVTAGGVVQCRENGSIRVSVSLPDLAVGVDRRFLIHWGSHADGSSVRSELLVHNLSVGSTTHAQATHAAGTVDPDHTLTVGGIFGGVVLFSGGMDFTHVRIGRRFHSTTEQFNDFVTETTPPTFTARRRTPLLTYPTTELPIASEGEFAGPAYLWAAAATRQASMRLVTPLVNVVARSPYNEDNTYGPARYFRAAPDDPRYHWSVRYLYHAFTSPKTNRVRVRVHARATHFTGGGSIATVHLRMYSVRNLQLLGQNAPQPMSWIVSDTVTLAAPQSAPGAWQDLGTMQIARDDAGLAYFVLGFSFGLDEGGPLEDETRLMINAVQIEPFHFDNDLEAHG